jgi:hypothetical protein
VYCFIVLHSSILAKPTDFICLSFVLIKIEA